MKKCWSSPFAETGPQAYRIRPDVQAESFTKPIGESEAGGDLDSTGFQKRTLHVVVSQLAT